MGIQQYEKYPVMIEWPDGSTSKGRTGTELLVRVGAEQCEPMNFHEIKKELSRRALAYPGCTGQYVQPEQPVHAFLRELSRVGLFKLTEYVDG